LAQSIHTDERVALNCKSDERNQVKWMKLGEACLLKAGKGISASSIKETSDDNNKYPCYGANGLRGFVNLFSNEGNYPLIGRQGALCGNVCFASGQFYATEHAVIVSNKEQLSPRFLFHLLTEMNLNQYKSNGAQPGLSVEKLNELSIPIPPLSEQERIVSILDKFDKLVNDISEGLPAEIAASRQRYEYYRDKLLNFKRKNV
jgi:type I restriction enzyme S subunit